MLEYTIDPVRAKEALENALARLGLTKHWKVGDVVENCLELARPVRVNCPNASPVERNIVIRISVDAICRIDAMDAIEGGGALDEYIERELHK